jgi:ABC-type sugar transport system substrate-binding protein
VTPAAARKLPSVTLRTRFAPLGFALVAACHSRSTTTPQVGVAIPADSSPFYQDLRRGLQHAADSLHLTLHFGAQPSAMDAMVIAPGNAGGGDVTIQGANGQVVSDVVSDSRQGGRLLGEYVARRLEGGGNVAILDQPGVARVRELVAGFREALASYPNIRIVAAPAIDDGGREVAQQKMGNLLATDQPINAVFATNDAGSLGAVAAIAAAGRKGIFVVAYDPGAESRAALTQGTLIGAYAAPDAMAIGQRGIEVVAAKLKGEPVTARVLVPVSVVSKP